MERFRQASGEAMTSFRLPYIHEFRDRHGKDRRYFRRSGFPRVALPGQPGSTEFMSAYNSAMEGTVSLPPSRYGNGTIGGLWTAYCRSATYANLSASSKRIYRQIISPILEHHGHRSVSGMKREYARQIVEGVGLTAPAMANLTISVLRLLFSFAVDSGWRSDNPCRGLKRYKGGEFRSWTDEELARYEQRWPLGTRERLTYDLLLYTTQRGGDAVNMKRSDIADGILHLTQQKTGTKLLIPIHSALERSIRASSSKGIFILGDTVGRPIQRRTLTGLIRRAAKQAGLPADCVAHGLRKSGMRLLAENGASENQLAAVSGHKSLAEVQRYTKAADQAGLARGAMKLIPDRK
jgi:integrase